MTNIKKWFSLEKLALMAIAIAILMRIINLGGREFWYDEVLSLLLSTGQKSAYKTPGDVPVILAEYTSLLSLPVESNLRDFFLTLKSLLQSLQGGEPHPPIFFLSQHLWLRLFGNSEAAMRSLNTLFSIGAIAGGYKLGQTILGHRGGLLLAALLGINPFYLFHSLNVRMYTPLVLWQTLSASAILHLIYQRQNSTDSRKYQNWLWDILLISSVAAGLLTFYLYAYWVIALFVLALYLDRQHWWQYSWRLGAGVMLTIPWMLWGGFKQIKNADINRFSTVKKAGFALFTHLQDAANTLGSNLLLGDWATSLPTISMTIAGCLVIVVIARCSISLWRKSDRQDLGIVIILGILPLLLALGVDIATKKFTLGFGWGRTMIFIIPGCLLLLTLWLERAISQQWRIPVACGLFLLYLTIGISDFSLRQRSVFHSVAELISQQVNQPTLIVMNSKAWGNVMRLAYYIPPKTSVKLLAQHPADLANSVEKVLQNEASQYSHILWLDSSDPVWSPLKTEVEKEQERQKTEQILSRQFQLKQTKNLTGTMSIDEFTAKLYTRSL